MALELLRTQSNQAQAGVQPLNYMRILIVQAAGQFPTALQAELEATPHQVFETTGAKGALEACRLDHFDAIVVGLSPTDTDFSWLPEIAALSPEAAIVLAVTSGAAPAALAAMGGGAFDCLAEPFAPEHVRAVLGRIESERHLHSALVECETRCLCESFDYDLPSKIPAVQRIFDVAAAAAASDSPIMLYGEPGTGKSLLARKIHRLSPRRDRALITVNCLHQFPEQLQRDLFGDAHKSAPLGKAESAGWLAAAEGGSILLENVGALPLPLQASLLRLIRDRQYQRVGDRRSLFANVRILSTAPTSLARAVAAGSFREDLYQSLHAFALNLPPLRDRLDDLEIVAQLQLKSIAQRSGKVMTSISPKAVELLAKHKWPGNFRELYYILECAVMRTTHTFIDTPDLQEVLQFSHSGRNGALMTLEEVEVEHIRRVISQSRSLENAAHILGINPATLFRKRKRLLAEEPHQ